VTAIRSRPTRRLRAGLGQLDPVLLGRLNWAVMKKISSRNATSTMGVMSMLTPMRRFFLSM
jgi:hypothetical protein